MQYVLKCITCQRTYSPEEVEYTCPHCGPVKGTLDVVFLQPPKRLSDPKETSLFRYKGLPFTKEDYPSTVPVGWTPLFDAPRLAAYLGVSRVLIKDETRNPSASTKDRATVMAISRAHKLKKDVIAAASTGNAASSLAVLAAVAQKRAVIFCPSDVPAPKLTQMLVFGATVVKVKGTYDQAFDLCTRAIDQFGWYSRNTATNPYLAEGKKTVAFEVFEQLGELPSALFVGVGDGCVFGSYYKAFSELKEWGFTDHIPPLYGVQAEGAAPLASAFEQGTELVEPVIPQTFADSISVGMPRDQKKALRAARLSGGAILAVSDDLIRRAITLLATHAGIFAEPAGAASLAGLIRLFEEGKIDRSGSYVLVVTGSGLKDIKGTGSAAYPRVVEVEPEVSIEKLGELLSA